MSQSLENISIDKIETDIMSVLYANTDIYFTQYTLFNKTLLDKYDGEKLVYIHPNFKSKFLIVLSNLMSKYDDIDISRSNEGEIYSVICYSDTQSYKLNSKNEKVKETEQSEETKQINESEQTNKNDNQLKYNMQHFTKTFKFDISDIAKMYDYIYDNNLLEYINTIDPWDGNSIYHNLVIAQNKNILEKLIFQDKFDYFIKNKKNQTPLEIKSSFEITKILLKGLENKFNILAEKLNAEKEINKRAIESYEAKINWLESHDYSNHIIKNIKISEFLNIKFKNFYQENKILCFILLVAIFILNFL